MIARLVQTHNSEQSQMSYRSDPTWNIIFVQTWEAIEYCSGLICASLIHLKLLIERITPSLLGASRSVSRHMRKLEYRAPRYLLEARDTMPWEGECKVRSVISATRLRGEEEPAEGGSTVRRDLESRESFHEIPEIVQCPKKVVVWGSKTF